MCFSGFFCVCLGKHAVRASDELMDKAMLSERNLSVRMNEMTAAVIRPLLANLPERVAQFNRRYHEVGRYDRTDDACTRQMRGMRRLIGPSIISPIMQRQRCALPCGSLGVNI